MTLARGNYNSRMGLEDKMEHKYIIVVDENNQPYIAHAFGDSAGYGRQRKNHKYVYRIKEGLGYRYFYTTQEYENYMTRLHRSDKKAFNKAKAKAEIHPDIAKSDDRLLAFDNAEDRRFYRRSVQLDNAQRRYKKVMSSPSSTNEEKRRAKRLLDHAKERYEALEDILYNMT